MKKQVMCMAALGLVAAMSIPAWAGVVALDIPNYSFEGPATGSFNMEINNWEDPGATGVFTNSGQFGSVITNADGVQMAFMNCFAGGVGVNKNNIFIDLGHLLEAKTYTLTVGVAARSDSKPADPANTKMQLKLFTRVPVLTLLAVQDIVYSDLSGTQLTYYSATVNAGDIPAAAIGHGFGIWLDSTVGSTGGDWTLDNVTLTMIPEPATMLLLGLGGLGQLKRRS